MNYNIKFHDDAKKDLESFDKSVKILIFKQIKKISENPEFGELLGNKKGMDLTGMRKIYVMKKKIRIVYQIIDSELVVFVISIGKRDKGVVYEVAFNRITN
jgi:mRNA interferase RelE/StbE